MIAETASRAHRRVDELFRLAQVERLVQLTVPQLLGVGHILQCSDPVATVPERLAHTWRAPLRPIDGTPPEISIRGSWHAKAHRSPGNQWLLRNIRDSFAHDASA